MDHYDDFEKLEYMHRQIHKKMTLEWHALSPLELTIPQANLLQCLERQGTIKVSDFAGCVGITSGALTSVCDKLDELGVIERTRDEGDRRVVNLRVSAKGRQALDSIREFKGKLVNRMLEGIPAEDLQVLSNVYSMTLRNLEAAETKQEPGG